MTTLEDEPTVRRRRYRDRFGIYRWEVLPPEPVDPEKACRSCLAKPWETCTNLAGERVTTHVGRIIARQCRCGSALKTPKSIRCQKCAASADREQDRTYRAKRRSAA